VLARDHPEGASHATSNCKFRLRAAQSATAPESDALRTAVRSLQGVFRGRPRGLPGLRMQREGCHGQMCSEGCGGVKRLVSQRGIRRIQPEQNGCMAVLLGRGPRAGFRERPMLYSACVSGTEKGQTAVRTRSRSRRRFPLRYKESRRVARQVCSTALHQHAASASIGLAAQPR
jgi:hypothetical protein